jgi:hypothetical protein
MTKTYRARAWGAGLACTLAALAAAPSGAAELPLGRIIVPSGTDPVQALYQAQSASRAATIRARWIAAGHSPEQAPGDTLAITGGTVAETTVTIGVPSNYPTLTMKYTAGTAGLNFISVEFVSPNGRTLYSGGYSQGGYTEAGKVAFALTGPLNLYSQPGKWTLYAATIYDNAGNATNYDQAGLATLFRHTTFQVKNTGTVDDAGPKIRSGKLQKNPVSLSAKLPTLKATISASDHGSGLYLAYVFIQPPGQTYSLASIAALPLPLTHGNLPAYNLFATSDPTGTWGITGFAVCDFAQNCVGSMTDADVVALFGTDNFTVTP